MHPVHSGREIQFYRMRWCVSSIQFCWATLWVSQGLNAWEVGQSTWKAARGVRVVGCVCGNRSHPGRLVVQPCDCSVSLTQGLILYQTPSWESMLALQGWDAGGRTNSQIWKSLGQIFYSTWYTWERCKKMWESKPPSSWHSLEPFLPKKPETVIVTKLRCVACPVQPPSTSQSRDTH